MRLQSFWNELPMGAGELIKKTAHFKDYKRHELIYQIGDQPKGMFILESGLVGLVGLTDKGAEHLLRLYKRNEFFGHRAYFSGEKYYVNALCLEACRVGFVSAEIVEKVLAEFPQTQRILIHTLAYELGLAEQQRIRITDQEVLQRIGHSLVYLLGIKPDYPWTRSEIAQFCASTTPTVVRGLAELESRQLISQNGRQISILDKDGILLL